MVAQIRGCGNRPLDDTPQPVYHIGMTRVDAHIHWNGDHEQWSDFLAQEDIKQINICVNHGGKDWRGESAYTRDLAARHPERFAWITTFDLPGFEDGEYAQKVIEDIGKDVREGAVGCKIWKNVGMEVRTPEGEWMMPDHSILDPIYAYLTKEEIPLVAHLGEPLACWSPLDESSPHYGYYVHHPEWHLHGRSDVPSHAQIIQARDRVLEQHPDLRVIGAHLGSLEYDVAEVVTRLDRFPNFAVDTSARMHDLAIQDDDTVREFLQTYHDRVLWGTDLVGVEPMTGLDDAGRKGAMANAARKFSEELRYYQGLGLSDQNLEEVFHSNSLSWYQRLPSGW